MAKLRRRVLKKATKAVRAGGAKVGTGRGSSRPKSRKNASRPAPRRARRLGVRVRLTESGPDGRDVAESAVEIVLPSDGVDTQGKRKGRRQAKVSTLVIEALGALGHSQRGRILRKLLEGPATYRALQGETGLRAGPLYHHIHQLRLAGLMLPKERDLYELSRGGRNLVVVAAALEKLVRDRRRLP